MPLVFCLVLFLPPHCQLLGLLEDRLQVSRLRPSVGGLFLGLQTPPPCQGVCNTIVLSCAGISGAVVGEESAHLRGQTASKVSAVSEAAPRRVQELIPPEAFTEEELQNGAVILHVIGMLYMFLALAIIVGA